MFHVKHSSLALYVHWPFCRSKCPYCDFNSHVAESINHEAWKEAYLKELAHFASGLKGKELVSIFFGGGTPSLMKPATVEAIISAASKHWPFAKDIEITLEANPTSAEAQKFKDFKAAGVSRLSMGIQALNDKDLKFLGREHSAKEALAALGLARDTWENFSFDLIYARPEQTLEAWQAELKQALSFNTPHLSLYQLTIEKGTPFYAAHERGEFKIPEEDLAASLYETTAEYAAKAGLFDYEVSNYAKPGFESKHNLVYWQYGEYLGIGPGAHSRLKTPDGRRALMMIHHPQNWLKAVEEKQHGTQSDETVKGRDAVIEALMMGLRLKGGLRRAELKELGEITSIEKTMQPMVQEKLIEMSDDYIRTTARGRMVLGGIMQKFAEAEI